MVSQQKTVMSLLSWPLFLNIRIQLNWHQHVQDIGRQDELCLLLFLKTFSILATESPTRAIRRLSTTSDIAGDIRNSSPLNDSHQHLPALFNRSSFRNHASLSPTPQCHNVITNKCNNCHMMTQPTHAPSFIFGISAASVFSGSPQGGGTQLQGMEVARSVGLTLAQHVRAQVLHAGDKEHGFDGLSTPI